MTLSERLESAAPEETRALLHYSAFDNCMDTLTEINRGLSQIEDDLHECNATLDRISEGWRQITLATMLFGLSLVAVFLLALAAAIAKAVEARGAFQDAEEDASYFHRKAENDWEN